MQIIYADLLFVIDFAANMLALMATSGICASPIRIWRAACACSLGGVYSVASLIPSLGFLMHPAVKVSLGIVMAIIAFGGQKGLLRKTVVFFAVAAAFGGAVYAVSVSGCAAALSFPMLLAVFAVCWLCVSLVFRRAGRVSGRISTLTVRAFGRELNLRAMTDTGNSLSDPLTGYPAAVVPLDEAKSLFKPELRTVLRGLDGKTAPEVMERLGDMEMAGRFRLIPYNAVGVKDGMLLAFRPDEVLIDGKKTRGMLVALSPESVSDGGAYSALIGTGV